MSPPGDRLNLKTGVHRFSDRYASGRLVGIWSSRPDPSRPVPDWTGGPPFVMCPREIVFLLSYLSLTRMVVVSWSDQGTTEKSLVSDGPSLKLRGPDRV